MRPPLHILGMLTEKNDPASRVRMLQYLPSLEQDQINIIPHFYALHNNRAPAKWMYTLSKYTRINSWRFLWLLKNLSRMPLLYQQWQYDLIWQNRLIILQHSWFEKQLKKPRVFDFDDAIWLHDGEKNVQDAIATATEVFAGNEYLATYASLYSKNVRIIPSVIDTSLLFPKEKNEGPFTIGWIGSASNIPYLEIAKPAILQFLRQYPAARFILVSSAPGNLFEFDNQRILFRPWSAETENELINSFSVGLMPLPDNTYTRGKCSYKMLQYMACGVPVLVSPVGTNTSILKDSGAGLSATDTDSWLSGLRTIKEDADLFKYCSGTGPGFIEQYYSVKKYAPVIAERFNKLTGK